MSWRGLLGLTLLLGAAAGSWVLLQSSLGNPPAPLSSDPSRPGYYLSDAAVLGTDADGRQLYRLEAASIRHLPATDQVTLESVVVRYSDGSQPDWFARAKRGTIVEQGALIRLAGEVVLQDGNANPAEKLLIETNTLDFRPRTRHASTEAEVKLSRPGVVLTARGMEANLAEERLQLKADINGRFNP